MSMITISTPAVTMTRDPDQTSSNLPHSPVPTVLATVLTMLRRLYTFPRFPDGMWDAIKMARETCAIDPQAPANAVPTSAIHIDCAVPSTMNPPPIPSHPLTDRMNLSLASGRFPAMPLPTRLPTP